MLEKEIIDRFMKNPESVEMLKIIDIIENYNCVRCFQESTGVSYDCLMINLIRHFKDMKLNFKIKGKSILEFKIFSDIDGNLNYYNDLVFIGETNLTNEDIMKYYTGFHAISRNSFGYTNLLEYEISINNIILPLSEKSELFEDNLFLEDYKDQYRFHKNNINSFLEKFSLPFILEVFKKAVSQYNSTNSSNEESVNFRENLVPIIIDVCCGILIRDLGFLITFLEDKRNGLPSFCVSEYVRETLLLLLINCPSNYITSELISLNLIYGNTGKEITVIINNSLGKLAVDDSLIELISLLSDGYNLSKVSESPKFKNLIDELWSNISDDGLICSLIFKLKEDLSSNSNYSEYIIKFLKTLVAKVSSNEFIKLFLNNNYKVNISDIDSEQFDKTLSRVINYDGLNPAILNVLKLFL